MAKKETVFLICTKDETLKEKKDQQVMKFVKSEFFRVKLIYGSLYNEMDRFLSRADRVFMLNPLQIKFFM